jgi:hypothetical protein
MHVKLGWLVHRRKPFKITAGRCTIIELSIKTEYQHTHVLEVFKTRQNMSGTRANPTHKAPSRRQIKMLKLQVVITQQTEWIDWLAA